jgi:hypothetical protein
MSQIFTEINIAVSKLGLKRGFVAENVTNTGKVPNVSFTAPARGEPLSYAACLIEPGRHVSVYPPALLLVNGHMERLLAGSR